MNRDFDNQSALRSLLAAALDVTNGGRQLHPTRATELVDKLRNALEVAEAIAQPASGSWTGECVLNAIADTSPPEWIAAFDDAELARASRPELLALLATAPNAVAAGFLTGVITQRNFH